MPSNRTVKAGFALGAILVLVWVAVTLIRPSDETHMPTVKGDGTAPASRTTFPPAAGLESLSARSTLDREDPRAVRRAVEEDLRALETVGLQIGVVDSSDGRVRVLVEDLTPAKKDALQERYGPLIVAENGGPLRLVAR